MLVEINGYFQQQDILNKKIDDALNDAAYMSSLATLSDVFDEKFENKVGKVGIYWLYRANDSIIHRNIIDPNAYIKREFYVRGNLKYDSEGNIMLKHEDNKKTAQLYINYFEDNDLSWYAMLQENTTIFYPSLETIINRTNNKASEQDSLHWINQNFSNYKEKIIQNPWIIINVSLD